MTVTNSNRKENIMNYEDGMTQFKSVFIIAGLFVGVLCASDSISTNPANTSSKSKSVRSQPNIILIYSDDHAYQAISAYGK